MAGHSTCSARAVSSPTRSSPLVWASCSSTRALPRSRGSTRGSRPPPPRCRKSWKPARKPGDTRQLMDRRLISGYGAWEKSVGYSRAVVVGNYVHVAGTAPVTRDGSPPPEGAYEQTKLCLEIIGAALERAGAGFEHVVRSRIYITDPAYFDDV